MDSTEPSKKTSAGAAFNFAAFFLAFLFVWLVFDNMALGFLAGFIAAGGAAAVQHKSKKST